MLTESRVPFGTGIYSQPEAAGLLGMAPPRLRRWVNGYTYWLRGLETARRRRRPPIIASVEDERGHLEGGSGGAAGEGDDDRLAQILIEKEAQAAAS